MCAICYQVPCHPRCPNAPEPPAVTTCRRCGESIVPGDEFAEIDSVDYCEGCIDDMPYCELLPLLGGEWKSVREGEEIKCCDCEEILPVGTEYGIIDGAIFCEECFDEIPYCDLVTRFGHDWRTAHEEDIYDGYND